MSSCERLDRDRNTYGEKPRCFQIEEGGEYYYIGSEVCIGVYLELVTTVFVVLKAKPDHPTPVISYAVDTCPPFYFRVFVKLFVFGKIIVKLRSDYID